MSPISIATASAALLLAHQTTGLTHADQAQCVVTGAEVISPSLTADDMCRSFRQQLAASLEEESATVQPEDLDIVIAISKNGSMTAQAHLRTGDGPFIFPAVGFDVMDRALAVQDMDHLAQSVAKVIALELEARNAK